MQSLRSAARLGSILVVSACHLGAAADPSASPPQPGPARSAAAPATVVLASDAASGSTPASHPAAVAPGAEAPAPPPESAAPALEAPVERERTADALLDVADARISIGSSSADGLQIAAMSCAMPSAPLFGTLAILGAIAKRDAALDRCAPQGEAVVVHWDFRGSKTDAVAVRGASPRVNACVTAAFKKVVAPMDAHCGAVLMLGELAGAERALAARLAERP